jgi:hypothetical protein
VTALRIGSVSVGRRQLGDELGIGGVEREPCIGLLESL